MATARATTTAKKTAAAKPAAKAPAKRAAPAAKAPTKAATTRRPAAKPVAEEEPDLLAGLNEEPAIDDDEELDLLDGITEDSGDAWMPADDDEMPEGIQGRVINKTYITTDYEGVDDVPMLEIEEKDGHVWSVRAYHTVLRNQIEKNDPEIGDLVALKYLGTKENKKGTSSYENYGMSCPACVKRKRG